MSGFRIFQFQEFLVHWEAQSVAPTCKQLPRWHGYASYQMLKVSAEIMSAAQHKNQHKTMFNNVEHHLKISR